MKKTASILELTKSVISGYNTKVYIGTFQNNNNIHLEELFESYKKDYYQFLLGRLVPEELRRQVDEEIQKLRPELSNMVTEVISGTGVEKNQKTFTQSLPNDIWDELNDNTGQRYR